MLRERKPEMDLLRVFLHFIGEKSIIQRQDTPKCFLYYFVLFAKTIIKSTRVEGMSFAHEHLSRAPVHVTKLSEK